MNKDKRIVHDADRAFNVWLSLTDQLLDQRQPLVNAMFHAGEKLQEEQQQSNGALFHPTDLWIATQEINLLLRRTPEFKERKAGWAKERMDQRSDL